MKRKYDIRILLQQPLFNDVVDLSEETLITKLFQNKLALNDF